LLALAAGYVFRAPWATQAWPFSAGTLSFIFIGAILAAIATPVMWISLSGEWGALAGGSLFPMVAFGGMAVYLWNLRAAGGHGLTLAWPVGCTAASLWSLGIYMWYRRVPIADPRPQPRPIRGAFVGFALVLVGAGTALVLETPGIMPWSVKPQSSVMFGWIFIGASASYAYAAVRASWNRARGPLIGFLAYDVILLPPLLAHFGAVNSEDVMTLIIYVSVLLYSAALGVWYLFCRKSTRRWTVQAFDQLAG
jgi:hypothetical protein